MVLKLFDTLSRTRQPLPDGAIKLYVCGVTPYDTTHLGHAFTFVQFDTLVRALRWLYPRQELTYLQNVTDVDDSILARARKLGVDWRQLGDEQTSQYRVDMRRLNVAAPTHLARATSAMSTIQQLTERLIDARAAYVADGGTVFFRVRASPTYGELSKLGRERMLEIASQQDDADVDDPRKEDALDFALWKGWSGDQSEPCWPSPWGDGRPGWHIECSALCYQFFGPQLTIHGGGADLIFPHHESEIAQTETATQTRPFVRLWMHTAMVGMDGAKMSKSLGNMVFIKDLLDHYSVDALRLYLLGHHYREIFEWSPAELEAAASLAERLSLAASEPDAGGPGARADFVTALEDDLRTPAAIEVLERTAGETLRELGRVLGLTLQG
ncbi:MAG: cysteine--tRNA ligase [Chloroflexota bacterium]|nr:cysteine--tRNA ligase [Chloroflexota bacterium]